MDSNSEGLVAIAEGQSLVFYSASQFFEDGVLSAYDLSQDLYKGDKKEGNPALSVVDTHKVTFRPLCVKFNRANQCFIAIAGTKQVEVVTISRKGKVLSKVVVDLMLDAFGRDLSITNINWLPESQTMLAISTRQFVRIYDLSLDNISPCFNLTLAEGTISDFCFSKPSVCPSNLSSVVSQVIVGSSEGNLYYQEIVYKTTGNANANAENAGGNMMDEDNSQIVLISKLQFESSKDEVQHAQCLAVYYSMTMEALIFTMEGNKTFISKLDLSNLDKLQPLLALDPIEENPSSQQLKAIWQKNGENLVCFNEVGSITQNGMPVLYLTAMSRKIGANTGIPVLIRIAEGAIDLNLLKPGNVPSSVT